MAATAVCFFYQQSNQRTHPCGQLIEEQILAIIASPCSIAQLPQKQNTQVRTIQIACVPCLPSVFGTLALTGVQHGSHIIHNYVLTEF
jgi:hypothetical protein